DEVLTGAILGYTNVGKSTLLNYLTNAGVLCEDMLFATLDPTARSLKLPDGRNVMLIDTVGLVSRLPHMLVEAFHSTLQEAADADLILNVCDISSPDANIQLTLTEELLKDLNAENVPVLHVLNKCDKLSFDDNLISFKNNCIVSAKTGFGIDNMLSKISEMLKSTHTRIKLLVPFEAGALVGEIRKSGKVFSEEYLANGTKLDILCDNRLLYKCSEYILTE
ncbi:MAG: GTPase, partial [Oscillospiraceae bacterium]